VREVVAAGRLAAGGLIGPLRRRDRELVSRAILRVGLGEHADDPLRTLSGGMQQRAFIAKALAGEPSLLVLDEPTTGVDAESQESLAALLDELHSELGVTIVYVSHEFGAVERFVQRLVLVRRTIVFDGAPHQLPGVWHDPSHVHARE
jgi:zinc transport system ATP-binding protein